MRSAQLTAKSDKKELTEVKSKFEGVAGKLFSSIKCNNNLVEQLRKECTDGLTGMLADSQMEFGDREAADAVTENITKLIKETSRKQRVLTDDIDSVDQLLKGSDGKSLTLQAVENKTLSEPISGDGGDFCLYVRHLMPVLDQQKFKCLKEYLSTEGALDHADLSLLYQMLTE